MPKYAYATALVLAAIGAPAAAQYTPGAAIIEPSISGVVQYDGWISLTSANYPGYGAFPGTAPWPAPIGSNRTPSNTFNLSEPGDANLVRIAGGAGGGPIPQSAAIYFGGFSATPNTFGGTVGVTDTSPVPNLRNVIFQVQIGEAQTHDFFSGLLPTLSYNGGSQNLASAGDFLIDQFFNGTVTMPTGPEPLYNNTYLLQWDLSAIAGTITDFTIAFSGVQHSQVYGMALHQSDIYAPVPAPSAFALLGLGGLALIRRRR